MKWLERLLGHSEYRQYGDNEYYEYPRNGVYLHESSNLSSSSSGWRESSQLVDTNSTRSWRGPCIFEDPHSVDKNVNRGTKHPYRESRQLYENEGYSRDTSRYVSQYGGTTEIYNPASGGFKELDHGRVNAETPVYNNRRYRTMNYEDHDARSDALARAMQDTLSLERYPASYGAPGVAPAPNLIPARATGSLGLATCAGCHRTLGFGRFLTCLNQNWHPACFCCRYCLQAIVDKEVPNTQFPDEILWN